MSHPTVEQRLSVLEKAFAELQQQLNQGAIEQSPIANNWYDRLVGSISDESAFLEALEYGRSYRQEK
ncbi:MAG: transferase hexapeptide repeat containing protein [Cyanobacteria bacterium P01_E01_bin.42]